MMHTLRSRSGLLVRLALGFGLVAGSSAVAAQQVAAGNAFTGDLSMVCVDGVPHLVGHVYVPGLVDPDTTWHLTGTHGPLGLTPTPIDEGGTLQSNTDALIDIALVEGDYVTATLEGPGQTVLASIDNEAAPTCDSGSGSGAGLPNSGGDVGPTALVATVLLVLGLVLTLGRPFRRRHA